MLSDVKSKDAPSGDKICLRVRVFQAPALRTGTLSPISNRRNAPCAVMFLAINEVMYGGSSVLEDLSQRGQHHLVDIDARWAGKHKQHGIGHLIATKAIAFFARMQRRQIGPWLRLVGQRIEPADSQSSGLATSPAPR